ncbi:hypothetical protein AB0M50_48910 [Nonomuraea fuscirosea]|uniref:hypothetical protein n=1 Tax=Nonomuraea fuscirosea TaxID=1291556 RepID=UPI00342AB2C0
MAATLAELHAAVPERVLRDVPVRPWQREALVDWVLRRCAAWQPREPPTDRAVKEGLRWLESWSPGESGVRPAFGAGDGNLANFLWDGVRVRECRRVHALTWLFLLSHESPRNPPGTFERQVERVLAILEA